MQKRIAVALVTLVVVATVVASAVVFLGPPRVRLADTPTEADKVTLYQSGLAFVELSRAFTSSGGESVLEFVLPRTALADSLVVEGPDVVVKEIRSSLPDSGLLHPGDAIIVHVEGTTYRGTLASLEGSRLVLATETGSVLIEMDRIVAIEVPDRRVEGVDPTAADLTVLVEAPAGTRDVRLTYLAQGPGWTPSYHMDAATGHLTFFATLTGLADWTNVSLDLVSGSPNLVLRPQPGPVPEAPYKLVAERSDALGAPAYDDPFGASTPLGDLHRYHYARPVDMKRTETLRLPVLTGDVDLLRHYYAIDAPPYAGTVTPLERLEVRNGLSEPLPPGVVRFYRDGTWIGEDMLASTPVGAHANVTLARSEDVQARVVPERTTTSGNVDTYSYHILVENRKSGASAETVDVRVTSRIPDYRTRLVSADPQPDETEGSLLIWNDTLAPGASLTYRVAYETSRG